MSKDHLYPGVYIPQHLKTDDENKHLWSDWRTWDGPWGIDIINITKYMAKIFITPYFHIPPLNTTVRKINIGKKSYSREDLDNIYNVEKGFELYLEPKGYSQRTKNHNRELVKIDNKLFYITVYLLKNDKWNLIISSKILSSHYNFYIGEKYERFFL